MNPTIRHYIHSDQEHVVQLSLRAWAPVFASAERVLGAKLFGIFYGGDWRAHQAKAVRDVLTDPKNSVWVAAVERAAVGFVAAAVHSDNLVGEVVMLAVDPGQQQRGIGTALTQHATDWFRSSGMRMAVVETGGDPGHAPARRAYEKAMYTPWPLVRYFQAL